jgi:hypothetical protein
MKKFTLLLFMIAMLTIQHGYSQMNCGTAVQQLQSYAAQVNQIYQNEYWQIIPNQRCPAFDAWGNPYAPAMVQNCRMQWLSSLNTWYATQCNYVNNWYAQIASACTNDDSGRNRPAPDETPDGGEQGSEIDTDEIEDLAVGVDDEKTVRIRIPKTAAGFRRGQ